MKKLLKGDLTRIRILDSAREIFNEKGINLTLDNLAAEMQITKGRITNHFSTKDKLFLAILSDYEDKLAALIQDLAPYYQSKSLHDYIYLLSRIMDLQYQFRCCIIYLNVLSPGQSELRDHTNRNVKRNIAAIKNRVSMMISAKLISEQLLEKQYFEGFIFIYINQLTQWVTYHDMYDHDKGYQKMKPLYLKAIILHVYGPFLTTKAKKELQNIDIEKIILA